jgi:hypothetical protein
MKTADYIIPRLFASIPHSSNAPFNLIEIADDIQELNNISGGLDKVSNIVGVSKGMLNRFLKVKKLTPQTKNLVKKRIIDSVSIVDDLTKFSDDDQNFIVAEIIADNIKGKDIRLLSPLRKQFPDIDIYLLIEKLKKSENKKISVIKFDTQDLSKDIDNLRKDLINITGNNELVDLSLNNSEGSIKLTSKGEKELRSAAKKQRKTFQEFIYSILK